MCCNEVLKTVDYLIQIRDTKGSTHSTDKELENKH